MKNFLKTLRRIPDDVILSMNTREFVMTDGETCLCGWAVAEQLTKLTNLANTGRFIGNDNDSSAVLCKDLFGGTQDEWDDIYHGVTNQFNEKYVYNPTDWYGRYVQVPNQTFIDIETAFVTRTLEALTKAK